MLEFRSCSAAYDATPVFHQLSLAVSAGETLAVVGPSGCGKTTLLSLLAGLKQPSAGAALLNGHEVRPGEAALIPQQYGLFPWFTALGNVELGLRVRGVPRAERLTRASAALEKVHLDAFAHRYPGSMSGGEQQRVAIARALALEPAAMLMDEPFSALDALTREMLQDLLLEVLRGREIPSVVVTHSIEEASYLGTTIAVMTGRPARLRMIETPRGRFAGQPGSYRLDPHYFDTCRRVRTALEEGEAR